MTTHSELSPSSAKRWMTCPGSVQLSRGIVEEPSVYAQEGTLAHALLEHMLVNQQRDTAAPFEVGTYTDEMQDGAQMVLDYVATRNEHIRDRYTEQSVTFGKLLPEGTSGTLDLALYYDETDTLEIVDYKFGRGVVVEPERNEQLWLYAVGALASYGYKSVTHIILTVIQPRASHPGGRIRSWETDMPATIEFAKNVAAAARIALGADPPLVPETEACRFCRAAHICPALKQRALDQAMQEFTTLPGADEIAEVQANLDLVQLLDVWIRAVTQNATSIALSGIAIPGYHLAEGRSNRKWVGEPEVRAFFKKRRIPAREFEQHKVLGIPAAVKLLKKRGIDPGVLNELIVKPPGKKVLVSDRDPREDVGGEFEKLDG